jgi:hypothetical protein
MIDHATRPTPASPLDPFLGPFLRQIAELTGGYAPASHGARVAASLGWAPAFAEAVFVSARARGLVEPYRGGGARARARWGLSARGRAWADRPVDDLPGAATRDCLEDAAPFAG